MNNNNSAINYSSDPTATESVQAAIPPEAPLASDPTPMINISVFQRSSDTVSEVYQGTFEDLAELCRNPDIRDEKDGVAFCPTVFEPQYRKKENAKECAVLVYDLDNLPQGIDAQMALSCVSPYKSFCYSTFSHKVNGKGNRYRVVVELAEPIPANEYKRIAELFGVNFEQIGIKIDPSCTSPAQMLYFPACPDEREGDFEYQSVDGIPLNWRELKQVGVVKHLSSTNGERGDSLPSEIPEGSRNTSLYKRGAVLRESGLGYDDVCMILLDFNNKLCKPPLDIEEVESIARSVADNVTPAERTLTQLVLAETVAHCYRDRLRWVDEWGCWMMINPNTQFWEKCVSPKVIGLLTDELKLRRSVEASLIQRSGAIRHQTIKQIERAENGNFLSGAEGLMRTIEGIRIKASAFDSDPLIVGAQGGQCIDLKTGGARDIQAEDYLTKSISSHYSDDAQCPIWKKSVLEWCCGDWELAKFLQEWCGYCLSGLTTFQGFLFLVGEGKNGKSVFVTVISKLMSDYASALNSQSLMVKSRDGASGDIAKLVGVRFVTSQEMPEGKQFDEPLLKELTGGDLLTARYLYREYFSFYPVLKLMISGNHTPIITGDDHGIWRRVNVVPFNATIENPDPQLTEKLLGELPGILNWCLEGWKGCNRGQLKVPSAVSMYSQRYKKDMDIIGHWKDDCVAEKPDGEIKSSEVYSSYQDWAKRNGFHPMSSRSFYRKLKGVLGEAKRRSECNYYLGYRLK